MKRGWGLLVYANGNNYSEPLYVYPRTGALEFTVPETGTVNYVEAVLPSGHYVDMKLPTYQLCAADIIRFNVDKLRQPRYVW